MAINQPPITGDQVMDAWLLEVTREINSGQSRSDITEANVRQISVITNTVSVEDWALKANAGEDIPDEKIPDSIARDSEAYIKSVTQPLSVTAGGELSISQGQFNNFLQARNVVITLAMENIGQTIFTFDAVDSEDNPFITEIFDTHFLFLGGMKLVETIEYDTYLTNSGLMRNQISITGNGGNGIDASQEGLNLELSNWSTA